MTRIQLKEIVAIPENEWMNSIDLDEESKKKGSPHNLINNRKNVYRQKGEEEKQKNNILENKSLNRKYSR